MEIAQVSVSNDNDSYLSFGVGFARFYDIRTTTGIQFEAVWLASIMNFSHLMNENTPKKHILIELATQVTFKISIKF